MLARTPAALKKRRYRRRRRDGVCVLYVEVKEAEFAEALLTAGYLTERQALRRDQLTARPRTSWSSSSTAGGTSPQTRC